METNRSRMKLYIIFLLSFCFTLGTSNIELESSRLSNKTNKSEMSIDHGNYDNIQEKECRIPLAQISGEFHHLPDFALAASSSFDNRFDNGPQCSRLGVAKPAGCFSFAWQASRSDPDPFIMVTLPTVTEIHQIATQGRDWCAGGTEEFVKSYQLSYLTSDGTFEYYKTYDGTVRTFNGNFDMNTVILHPLTPPLVGQIIRLNVRSCNDGRCSLRWELYGYRV